MSDQDDLPLQIHFMTKAVVALAMRMHGENQGAHTPEVSVGLSEVVADDLPYPTAEDIATVTALVARDAGLITAGISVGFDEQAKAFVFIF